MEVIYIRAEQVAYMLKISLRGVQKKCKKEGLKKDRQGYLISKEVAQRWLLQQRSTPNEPNQQPPNRPTEKKAQMITEKFTPEAYAKLETIIKEYPILQERIRGKEEQILMLKDNLHLANRRLDLLLETIKPTLEIINQENTLKFIDKTQPEKND